MDNIHCLANTALVGIKDYCIDECKAYCCRKGYLILKKSELDLVVGNKKEDLMKHGDLKEMLNGKYSLNLGNFSGSCPQLKNYKCKIHGLNERPDTCKSFPIFIVGKEIKISSRCPAKKENKFFKFIKEAEKEDYKIIENF